MGRRRRRIVAIAVGVPLLAVAVLGAEVEVARRGDDLDDVQLTYADAGPTPVLWLGDSTAFGVGVTDGADTVASLVAEARGERVLNIAVSGATLADVVGHQRAELPTRPGDRPERIYISVGANDVTHLTRVEDFFVDYRDLLARLPDVEIVVLGVPDMGAPPRLPQPLRAIAGWRGRRLDREVRRAAARNGRTTYVDIAGRTGPAFRTHPDRYFAADGYHPDAAGYRLWADAVLATVGP